MSNVSKIVALFPACHANALSKGWWDEMTTATEDDMGGQVDPDQAWSTLPSKTALIHSELSEALEDLRDGRIETTTTDNGKPVGAISELADVAIRLGDLCGALAIYFEGPSLDHIDGPADTLGFVFIHDHAARLGFLHATLSEILGEWVKQAFEVPEDLSQIKAAMLRFLAELDQLANDLGGDLVKEMQLKMSYNAGRSYRHGGKLF